MKGIAKNVVSVVKQWSARAFARLAPYSRLVPLALGFAALAGIAVFARCARYPAGVPAPQAVFYSVDLERPEWVRKAPRWVRSTGAKWQWVRDWSAVAPRDSVRGLAAVSAMSAQIAAYGPCTVARLNGGLAVAWRGRWVILRPARPVPGLTPRTPEAARDYQAALAKR